MTRSSVAHLSLVLAQVLSERLMNTFEFDRLGLHFTGNVTGRFANQVVRTSMPYKTQSRGNLLVIIHPGAERIGAGSVP